MIGKTPRRWPSAKAQSEISEPNPYRARHRQPQIIDDGMLPKPTIFALSRACIARGTGSSNPSPSSKESANFQSLEPEAFTDAVFGVPIVTASCGNSEKPLGDAMAVGDKYLPRAVIWPVILQSEQHLRTLV
jgi:hypothetical protein